MVEKKDIEECFAEELNWIKNKAIREDVVNLWMEAANRGNWKDIDDAPFTLLIDNSGKLTEHTKRITHLAKGIYDLISAIEIVKNNNPEIKLKLYGNKNKIRKRKLGC